MVKLLSRVRSYRIYLEALAKGVANVLENSVAIGTRDRDVVARRFPFSYCIWSNRSRNSFRSASVRKSAGKHLSNSGIEFSRLNRIRRNVISSLLIATLPIFRRLGDTMREAPYDSYRTILAFSLVSLLR